MPPLPDPPSAPEALAEAQAALRAWRAAHPQATFYAMEVETERQLARVRAALVGELVRDGAAEAARPSCPSCRQPMQQVGQQHRTVLLPHDETVTVQGPRYRCPACGAGLFPPG
jgi:YgiT-type zinc finger domain-containing protein